MTVVEPRSSATVFISNQAKDHNYEPARKYGALRAITSGNYPIFKTVRLRDEIVQALTHSRPDDYLLLSGSSVVAGLCTSIWMLTHGQVNLLLYDRKAGEYVTRQLTRDAVLSEIERARDVSEEVQRP